MGIPWILENEHNCNPSLQNSETNARMKTQGFIQKKYKLT